MPSGLTSRTAAMYDLTWKAVLNLGTGACGLRIVMEKVMRDIMFDAPKEVAIDHAAALTLKKEYIMPTLRKEYKLAE